MRPAQAKAISMKLALFIASVLVLAGCGGSPMSVETRDPSWKSLTSAQDAANAERLRRQQREGNAAPGNM